MSSFRAELAIDRISLAEKPARRRNYNRRRWQEPIDQRAPTWRSGRPPGGQSRPGRVLDHLERAGAGSPLDVEAVDPPELGDAAQGRRGEGRAALEGMEHDAFQQVAKRQVVELGQRLEHLDQALLHAHAGLDPFDRRTGPGRSPRPEGRAGRRAPGGGLFVLALLLPRVRAALVLVGLAVLAILFALLAVVPLLMLPKVLALQMPRHRVPPPVSRGQLQRPPSRCGRPQLSRRETRALLRLPAADQPAAVGGPAASGRSVLSRGRTTRRSMASSTNVPNNRSRELTASPARTPLGRSPSRTMRAQPTSSTTAAASNAGGHPQGGRAHG